MNKYCAFDLEIVKDIPSGTDDWRTMRPLGVSCAATMCSGAKYPIQWFHKDENGEPIAGAMTEKEVGQLVDYLAANHIAGYKVLTWNGLGFDFDVLAEESGRFDECRDLAMNHVDMMFHFFCAKGYMLGLNTAAKGLGLSGKTEGMHGDLAPVMWAKSLEDRQKVLEYVGQDARTTLEVAEKAEELYGIKWISRSGKLNTFRLTSWFTVKDCLELIPMPDNSWMDAPKNRADFYAWTGR